METELLGTLVNDNEILNEIDYNNNMDNRTYQYIATENQKIIVELLLDIRNLLTKKEEKE